MEAVRGWSRRCLIVAFVFISACSGLNSYQKQGNLRLVGLTEPVKVMRDEKGMAYIYAANLEDAIMTQGFVAAQDRLFNMELIRMLAAGRISELTGEKSTDLDRRMRTIGFYRHGEKQARLLAPGARRFFQKYIDGVNAFIMNHPESHHLEFKLAGIKPRPWSMADSLAIIYYLSWETSANLNTEIIAQMLVEKLGPQRAGKIFPLNINPDDPMAGFSQKPLNLAEPVRLGLVTDNQIMGYLEDRPHMIGSNNWAAGASHSPGGKPIVANDPHLDARILPGPLYPCGIITPKTRVVGVNFAGVPGMLVFRNAHVALGITNAYGDTQDLYVETIDPQNPDNYLEGDQSLPFKIIEETITIKDKKSPGGFKQEKITLKFTKRGPVVSGIFPYLRTDKVLSLRWSLVENMGTKMGLGELMQVKSAHEVREALKHLNFLMLNFTFADTEGNIGWHVPGNLPIRSNGDGTLPVAVTGTEDNWIGWIPFDEMPQIYSPEKDWVGTCNHNTIPNDYPYYYSSHLASSYRYSRLKQLLDSDGIKTVDDHWQYQRDTLNIMAKSIAPLMARALAERENTKKIGEILSRWNCHDDPDLSAPTIFQGVYRKFAYRVFEDELGQDLTETMLNNWYFWQENLGRMVIENNSPWFDNVKTTDMKESRDDLFYLAGLEAAAELGAAYGRDPEKWQWGKVHRIEFVSPLRREGFGKGLVGGGSHAALGSGETLGRGIYGFNNPFDVTVFASLRMVADLADPDKVLAVLPGGVSGRLFDEHYKDQIEPFMNGNKVYWWFSDAAIKAHCRATLVLKP